MTPAKNSSFISMLMCNVTLEKPDVILVENLDDLNTNSIILNVRFLSSLYFCMMCLVRSVDIEAVLIFQYCRTKPR